MAQLWVKVLGSFFFLFPQWFQMVGSLFFSLSRGPRSFLRKEHESDKTHWQAYV